MTRSIFDIDITDATVTWVLTPLIGPPDRPYQYHAVSSCPHGQTAHQIGGLIFLLLAGACSICRSHWQHTRCRCPNGVLVVRSADWRPS